MAELPGDVTWRRSSFSGGGNNCVEISRTAEVVGVRDSKDAVGDRLVFARADWSVFQRRLRG